jgi:hypothetical protein
MAMLQDATCPTVHALLNHFSVVEQEQKHLCILPLNSNDNKKNEIEKLERNSESNRDVKKIKRERAMTD